MTWVTGTAQACAVAYATTVLGQLAPRSLRPPPRLLAAIWTVGLLLLILHTFAAFHAVHGWSHQAAFDHTAERSSELVGIRAGWGLYLNELAIAAWLIDVVLAWRQSLSPISALSPTLWRPRIVIWLFLAFMQFQACVVFGRGFIRWFGLVVTLAAGWLLWHRHHSTIATKPAILPR
jgi:hypothetical protein